MRKKIILGLGAMALIFAANLPSKGAKMICPSGDTQICSQEAYFVIYKGEGRIIFN